MSENPSRSLSEVYAAKEERRRRLAALPLDEKIKIIEFLHSEGMKFRQAKREGRIKFIAPLPQTDTKGGQGCT